MWPIKPKLTRLDIKHLAISAKSYIDLTMKQINSNRSYEAIQDAQRSKRPLQDLIRSRLVERSFYGFTKKLPDDNKVAEARELSNGTLGKIKKLIQFLKAGREYLIEERKDQAIRLTLPIQEDIQKLISLLS